MTERFVFAVEFAFSFEFYATRSARRAKYEKHPNTILHFENLDDGTLPRISVLDRENSVLKPRKRNISAVMQLSGLFFAIDSRKDSHNVSIGKK